MVIATPDSDPRWAYRNAIATAIDAVVALIKARAIGAEKAAPAADQMAG